MQTSASPRPLWPSNTGPPRDSRDGIPPPPTSGASSSASNSAIPKSKLLMRRELDEADELDKVWSDQHRILCELAFNVKTSEKDINNILQDRVSESPVRHNEVTLGLLYGICTEPSHAAQYFRYLHFVVRDSFAFCVSELQRLVGEKYSRLLETPRSQLIWLLNECIKLNIRDVDSLIGVFLRHIQGGDIGNRTISLTTSLVEIFKEHRAWLLQQPKLVPLVFYTCLRVLSDHTKPNLNQLRTDEIELCVHLWREKSEECCQIGRDLVRVLQDVSRLPGLEPIWEGLMAPVDAKLKPNYTRLWQVLETKTPKRYLHSRLTPEQETQLVFIMTQVKQGNHKRYQQWFQQKHLATPESDSFIQDLVRFTLSVYHPPNSIISSDIVQRWAVIGWLLKCCRSAAMAANVKLALFYDWLFFQSKTDNLMNLEPGMLLMIHSLPKYADITNELLEFLVLAASSYDPPNQLRIRKNVHQAFKILQQRGVVNALEPLANDHRLEQSIRERVKQQLLNDPTIADIDTRKLMTGGVSSDGTAPASPTAVSPIKALQPAGTMSSSAEPITGIDRMDVDGGTTEEEVLSSSSGPFSSLTIVPPTTLPVSPAASPLSHSPASSPPPSALSPLPSPPADSTIASTNTPVPAGAYVPSLTEPRIELIPFATPTPMESEEAEEGMRVSAARNGFDATMQPVEHSEPLEELNGNLEISSIVVPPSLEPLNPAISELPKGPGLPTETLKQLLQQIIEGLLAQVHSTHSAMLFDFCEFFIQVCSDELLACPTLEASARPQPFWHFLQLLKVVLHQADETRTELIWLLLKELRKRNKTIGLRWLCCLMTDLLEKPADDDAMVIDQDKQATLLTLPAHTRKTVMEELRWYRRYLEYLKDRGTPKELLAQDLAEILNADFSFDLLFDLLPAALEGLDDLCVGSVDLVTLLMQTIDPVHLYKLSSSLYLQQYRLFGPSPNAIISKSLSFDSFEQMAFWQLLVAEFSSRPSEVESWFPGTLRLLQVGANQELMSGVHSLLGHIAPSSLLIDVLLRLPSSSCIVVALSLSQWSRKFSSQFLSVLAQAISHLSALDKARVNQSLEHLLFWRNHDPQASCSCLGNEAIQSQLKPLLTKHSSQPKFSKLIAKILPSDMSPTSLGLSLSEDLIATASEAR
eukprot:GILK01010219.1.p1 GENE.GILK01010219.1~~GILK01010219.1.p1  ORF type:complete len:1151 (-),score=163.04 GILK01010219.1:154-3606(-)